MTLRIGVIFACVALIAFALVQIVYWSPTPWLAVGCEVLAVLGLVIFEVGRYRPKVDTTRGTWQATGERFEDPTSGKIVDVYANPETGERDYRPSS